MPTPSSPETEGDAQARPDAEGRRLADDDVFLPTARPRPSVLRLLAIAAVSIIVTGLLFRAAVEAVRSLTAP